MPKFICSQCGACCRNIAGIKELRNFDIGNGTCRYLRENKCTIYNKRPDICKIEAMYDKIYRYRMSASDYYKMNYNACSLLRNVDI